MKFLLQKDDGVMDLEKHIFIDIVKQQKYLHEYREIALNELNKSIDKELIPIGSIEFVTKYLNITEGFIKENPIEIPKYLRNNRFIKREYSIVTWDKIPYNGKYFLKDASTLKHFSYCGNLEHFIHDKTFEENDKTWDTSLKLSKDALYVLSEAVDIKAEFRVYVEQHEIIGMGQYDGKVGMFPDIEIIQQAINLIKVNEKYLKSYTIDVMVTNYGTELIEIHNFTSCGLYITLFGNSLLYAYRDGIDYLLKDNKKLEV